MTSSTDTPKPKKPTLTEIPNVARLHEEESDDPHAALYEELYSVIENRVRNFDLTYLGILGALELLKNDILTEMNNEI